MQTNERLKLLLEATPDQIAAVDAALVGRPEPAARSLRLFRMSEAAAETGISRTTLWRAVQEGRLRTVEIREGSRRIPEAELRRFVEGV